MMRKALEKLTLCTIRIGLLVSCSSNQQKNESSANMSEDQQISKSEIVKTAEGYVLMVNNEPFYIKGAGIEFGNIAKLAQHGGNSFRTWRIDNGMQTGMQVLDEAQKYGLKVTLGIDVGKERHGFDYNNKEQVDAQLERIRNQVIEHKDHPALIIWAIGNELNLHMSNRKVWDAVNDISKMIHKVDPNHLTTTTLAGMNKELVNDIKKRASDLDLLSVQMYRDIIYLPEIISATGWDGPYIVTEWGATGHWEVEKTSWDVPIEDNSSVKANNYLERYKKSIETQKGQCLGSYVFLWGQKQERTPTWYGMFLENGNETEAVDVMHYIWNNQWPDNRAPALEAFTLDNKTATDDVKLKAGETYDAKVKIKDHEGDDISYMWEIKPESTDLGEGGDFETTPESLICLIEGSKSIAKLTAPKETGAYRLFVYASDGNNHSAHANIPFYVQ